MRVFVIEEGSTQTTLDERNLTNYMSICFSFLFFTWLSVLIGINFELFGDLHVCISHLTGPVQVNSRLSCV